MVIPNSLEIPPLEQRTVPHELLVSQPALKAGAFHLGQHCEFLSKEFILCRNEMRDPRKCLKEGAELTACGVHFFQLVKKNCRDEFTKYMNCIDCNAAKTLRLTYCRPLQRIFDNCMLEKLNMERPPVGYYGRPKVHDSVRPPPPPEVYRDYNAEAQEIGAQDDLPKDYQFNDEWKRYAKQGFHPWTQ